jgi:hypothetical protein
MPPQACSDAKSITGDTHDSGLLAAHEDYSMPETPKGGAIHEQPEAAAFAEAIKRAGMAGPAAIALRIAGPLAWIGGQMLWAVQPLLQGLGIGSRSGKRADADPVSRLARFLEGEGNVSELVTHLEAGAGTKASSKSRHSTGGEHGPV